MSPIDKPASLQSRARAFACANRGLSLPIESGGSVGAQLSGTWSRNQWRVVERQDRPTHSRCHGHIE